MTEPRSGDDKTTRYCPWCAAAVSASSKAFDRPRECPRCGRPALFFDYVNEPPAVETTLTARRDQPFHTQTYRAGAVIALVSLAAAALSLLGGRAGFAFVASAIVLCAAAVFTGFVFWRIKDLTDLSDRVEALERALRPLVKRVGETNEALMGMRRNLKTLEAEAMADGERMMEFARERERTIDRLGKRFLADSNKTIKSKMRPDTHATARDKLQKVIDFCRKHEYEVTPDYEGQLIAELKTHYRELLRKDAAKKEQAEIRQRIRDEQKAERELAARIKAEEAERARVEEALREALAKAADGHSAEVEALKAQLAEAEARSIRTQSMAELTRTGHVYVISNVGSFGEGVFKVGMTRRLEPADRIKELGDASVPFPFDVHMMISCDDAPTLEKELHRRLHRFRVNRVNLRKEYFRVPLESIRSWVEELHGEVEYEAEAEALEYREGLAMSEEEVDELLGQMELAGASLEDEEDNL